MNTFKSGPKANQQTESPTLLVFDMYEAYHQLLFDKINIPISSLYVIHMNTYVIF